MLLRPNQISFTARIDETELRRRLVAEVLESIGSPVGDDGKLPIGVTSRVTRGAGKSGGYVVEIFGPAPARILLGVS